MLEKTEWVSLATVIVYCRIDGVNSLGTVVKISRNKVNEKMEDYE